MSGLTAFGLEPSPECPRRSGSVRQPDVALNGPVPPRRTSRWPKPVRMGLPTGRSASEADHEAEEWADGPRVLLRPPSVEPRRLAWRRLAPNAWLLRTSGRCPGRQQKREQEARPTCFFREPRCFHPRRPSRCSTGRQVLGAVDIEFGLWAVPARLPSEVWSDSPIPRSTGAGASEVEAPLRPIERASRVAGRPKPECRPSRWTSVPARRCHRRADSNALGPRGDE